MKIRKVFFLLVGMIILIQFSFFGFKYFNVVDDNNQLGVYNLRKDDILNNVILHYKLYNVRPLAFFSDAYVFQHFWCNLYILLVIILILHSFNLFFIYKIAQKIDITLNAFCLILFGFCPILVESLYWISASTRIVLSIFLCLASIYLVLLYFEEKNKAKKTFILINSILLNMICVGYYEQTIAINLFLFSFILICLKKYKFLFIPLLSTSWISIWYIHFMLIGKMQERGTLNVFGIFQNVENVINEICRIYNEIHNNIWHSLNMGEETILNSGFSLLLIVALIALIYYIFKNKIAIDKDNYVWKKLVLGIFIFLVPFLPFLVLKSSFIALRNLYFSLLGISIIIEAAVDISLRIIKSELICNMIKTSIIFIAIILSVILNIDGVNNYKKVYELDNKVANQIIDSVNPEIFENKKSISINYNLDELIKYKNVSNYVESAIESDWALAGKLQVIRNRVGIGEIYINCMQKEADVSLWFDDKMNLIKKLENIERKGTIYEQ